MTSTFGKRSAGNTQISRTSAPMPASDARDPPEVTFHGSHLERHWPKYGAAAFALFAMIYSTLNFKGDILTSAIVGAVAYFVTYRAMSGFRKSVDNMHVARSQLFRSFPFTLGAALGFGFFSVATFIAPVRIFGFPIGGDNPFIDGLDQSDFAGIAMLILGTAGFMVGGGAAFEFVAGIFRRPQSSED